MEQINAKDERNLDDVVVNSKDKVVVMGRRWRVGWLRPFVRRNITHTMLKCKEEDEVLARCAAYILLGSPLKVWLWHWCVWRMLWYYASEEELLDVVVLGKKKADAQAQACLTGIIYLTGMKDTMMQMTRAEAERTLRELRSGRHGG